MRSHVRPPRLRLFRPAATTYKVSFGARANSITTPPSAPPASPPPAAFQFVSSYDLFAKRPPRPFPPPFHTPPPSSFSDPLTNHPRERPEGAAFLSGVTNGDDAILTSPFYLAVADGVGAWNTRSHGHAALWSRLVLHFWGKELSAGQWGFRRPEGVDPVRCLQEAYQTTIYATTNAGARGDQVWQGTTTVCGAVLKDRKLVVLNLGDSVAIVWRKGLKKWLLRTKEQWHWFDCPRQLGTNSPDTPVDNAVVQEVEVQDGDLVLLATDGLVDNMWDAEILTVITGVMEAGEEEVVKEVGEGGDQGRMKMLSQRILEGAKKTAIDPFAESPYMERSIEMGLGIEGGKWDDISVVAAVCRPTESG
ncbi:phosphatase 2C-like domain-containing protein [Sphaerosporella brunnea]|uniref:Protein phosphatase n=1 Tax=Sphaerosporella brunnea TaxID=1250544 RepID=A0A5J5EKD8_9PEZI|nr:phosphatase 2C-like domain-containing protein [Sphaerosporella brunnea]